MEVGGADFPERKLYRNGNDAAAASTAENSPVADATAAATNARPSDVEELAGPSKEGQEVLDSTLTSASHGDMSNIQHLASFDSSDAKMMSTISDLAQEQSYATKAVSPQRKQELLLQARDARRKWIARVPTPYLTKSMGYEDDVLEVFQRTYAHTKLPSAAKLLQELLDTSADDDTFSLREQLHRLVGSAADDNVFPTGQEILETELISSSDAYLTIYSQFWKKLQEPASSVLVQSMRKTLNLLKLTRETAGAKMMGVLDSIFAQLQQHFAFKEQDQLKRCLEAFVYGQCYQEIRSLYDTQVSRQAEAEFQSRLEKLQFLTLKHLDSAVENLDASEAIAALRSMDSYYSVYDKLQRVLALYQSINDALRAALQTNSKTKAPGADDVLPAIILVVIQARSSNLLVNLQMVEEFSPQEYLRGEAGYAFTNLFGAVQFLQELDLDQPLNMSPNDWKMCLDRCITSTHEYKPRGVDLGETLLDDVKLPVLERIPPEEIRQAIKRGETVDIEWARQWYAQQSPEDAENDESKDSISRIVPRSDSMVADNVLPSDFNRSYKYLNVQPEDLRLVDVTPLLDEYRVLVQTTEALLADHAHAHRQQRKADALTARKELYRRICQADAGLVGNDAETK